MKCVYSLQEVQTHNSDQDAWIVIDNNVYDVNKFLHAETHPGGEAIFIHAGGDVTDIFQAYHPDYVTKKKLPKYLIGILDKPILVSSLQKEYRELHAQIKADGLYETNYAYWIWKLFYPVALCAFGVYLGAFSGATDLATYLLAGFLIGLGQQQAAFIGHDACHVSITRSWPIDMTLSLIWATYIFGVSSIWWRYTHNQHHLTTNEYDRDPDIAHLPFYAANKFMFLAKRKVSNRRSIELPIIRFVIAIQWLTFLPFLVCFARLTMVVNHLVMLFIMKKVPTMPWQKVHFAPVWVNLERAITICHIITYYYIFAVTVPEGFRLPMLCAQHFTVSLIHVQFKMHHWERPSKHSSEEADNWFIKQVVSGRNVESNAFNNWIYGGFNYQIEHHLYPRMPRHNLRTCRDKYVRPFCAKHGISYCSTGIFKTLFDVISHLRRVSFHAFDHQVDD